MIDKIENYILEHSNEPNFLDSYRVYLVSEGITNIDDAILGDEQITAYSNRILHGEIPSTEMYEYFHKVSGNDFSAIDNYPDPEILMSLALDARMIDESEYKNWYEDKELEKYLAPYPTKAELIDKLGPSLQEVLDNISDEDAPKVLESIDTPLATWQLTSSDTDPEDFGIRGSIRKMINTIKRAKTKQARELESLKETQRIIDREMSTVSVNALDVAKSLSNGNPITGSATNELGKVARNTKSKIGALVDSTTPRPSDASDISDKIESNLKNITKDSMIQSSDDQSSENVDSHGISMGLNEMNNQNDQSARDMNNTSDNIGQKLKKPKEQNYLTSVTDTRSNDPKLSRKEARRDNKTFAKYDQKQRKSLLKGDSKIVIDEFGNKTIKQKGALDRLTNKMIDNAPKLAIEAIRAKSKSNVVSEPSYQQPGSSSFQVTMPNAMGQETPMISINRTRGGVNSYDGSENDFAMFTKRGLSDLKKYGIGAGVGMSLGALATMRVIRQAEIKKELENSRSDLNNDWMYIPNDNQPKVANMSMANKVYDYIHSDFNEEEKKPSKFKKFVGGVAKAAVGAAAAYGAYKAADKAGLTDKLKDAFNKIPKPSNGSNSPKLLPNISNALENKSLPKLPSTSSLDGSEDYP